MKCISRKVIKQIILINNTEIELYEFIELLEELESIDKYFEGMVIYDDKIKKYLEKREIIRSNNRGAVYLTNDAKRKRLLNKLYKFCG